MDVMGFAIGDVVRLTCPSDKMTVDKIAPENADGAVGCVWFNAAGDIQMAFFHTEELILVRGRRDDV